MSIQAYRVESTGMFSKRLPQPHQLVMALRLLWAAASSQTLTSSSPLWAGRSKTAGAAPTAVARAHSGGAGATSTGEAATRGGARVRVRVRETEVSLCVTFELCTYASSSPRRSSQHDSHTAE
eukprot:5186709-Pleurochrysis_carterae.AAC.2